MTSTQCNYITTKKSSCITARGILFAVWHVHLGGTKYSVKEVPYVLSSGTRILPAEGYTPVLSGRDTPSYPMVRLGPVQGTDRHDCCALATGLIGVPLLQEKDQGPGVLPERTKTSGPETMGYHLPPIDRNQSNRNLPLYFVCWWWSCQPEKNVEFKSTMEVLY